MKKAIAFIAIIILLGSIFFLRNYLNSKPLQKTIWIEKDISKNSFIRPNSLRDTVLILDIKGDFLQTESTYYGLIETFNIPTFKAKYERCLDCEVTKFRNNESK